jgi:hypothetical protein
MDKKNVQKLKNQNTLFKKPWFVTIIENYALVIKKIILKMLA